MKNFIGAFLLFMIMALANQATAGQFWSEDKTTNGLIVASNVLLAADWAQTRYATDRPTEFHESGLAEEFIGIHPTTSQVNHYFAAVILTSNTLGYFLPEKATTFGFSWNPKKSFYIGITAVEGKVVYDNIQVGVKLDI
jgi:hypothetical protein